jgi:hypothetical protein
MISRMTMTSSAKRAAIALGLLAVLAGSGLGASGVLDPDAHASTDPAPSHGTSGVCLKSVAPTVLSTLGEVAMRVYHEGVSSERTAAALSFIARSIPLREAVERGDAQATRAAAEALTASGHMTNLKVFGRARTAAKGAGQVLANVGPPNALAPLRGTILSAQGVPIATFIASVWADNGFISEADGITQGAVALRVNGHSIAGSFALPSRKLPAHGTLTERGVAYQYTSFPAAVFPTGSLRVYLLRSISSTTALCGQSEQATLVHTLSRVASLIYEAEEGSTALKQLHRVQQDSALLQAVAARDQAATREAILGVLHAGTHVVRMHVLAANGSLLSDVGGPDVLAPVRGPLRLHGHTIGSVVLSIQDDLGYMLLAQRLAGLRVVMYRNPTHPKVVMSSFRVTPAGIPAEGKFRYQGHKYDVFTLHAEAFPSGPLRISVLIPIPYTSPPSS